ncbi:MAG: substrate-binding domain-containing protein [Candidatus Sulfotelmatobacter sp.]
MFFSILLNRYEGYVSAMKGSGLEPNVHTYSLADDPFENGHAAVTYILERKYPATAMLCGSEELALGAREALRQHGRDVPRDVSLIGFEHKLTHSRSSNVTSVSIDTLAVGRELARMATALNESFGKDQPEIIVPATLLKRSTCRSFPAKRRYSPITGVQVRRHSAKCSRTAFRRLPIARTTVHSHSSTHSRICF